MADTHLPIAATTHAGPAIAGIPVEFLLFAATLLGVALFHRHTLRVAVVGVLAVTAYKLAFASFGHDHIGGLAGLGGHLAHEWVTLANLLGLLLGFEILAHHFSSSRVPALLPRWLPNGWLGGFVLLVLVFALSGFLDNIAAAMIGGTVAATVFKHRLHVGYLAGIVAAANAGGAGSVVGDTTTTMMWISGVSPLDVLEAYIGGGVALLVFGVIAARQQHALQPIAAEAEPGVTIDWGHLAVVAIILAGAVATNVVVNVHFSAIAGNFPFLGAAVWVAIVLCLPLRTAHWSALPSAARGAAFLLCLVLSASMMPVEQLPTPSWATTLGLGFVSAVFDNIPLTALAIRQGGYDWGFLAYAVGFGGSMLWFGSSAGVALANTYVQARSVGAWLRHGWHVALAFVIGYGALLAVVGWRV